MRVAVIGNCHADIVAQVVRMALRSSQSLDCRHIVSYESTTAVDQQFIAEADRTLIQVTDFKNSRPGAQDQAINYRNPGYFPLVAVNFLYPGAGKPHPRASESRTPYCPSGYFEGQVSDQLLIRLMTEYPHDSSASLVQRYLDADYAKIVDLDRIFEMNRIKSQRIGAAASMDLWPKIEAMFRYVPLFWTYLHPAGSLLRDICRHALRQLDVSLSEVEIEAAVDTVKEPLGFAHMPIHPSIVRHFGIEWATPRYRYRMMPEGRFTVSEFALRYVTFEHNDDLNRLIFNIHNNIELNPYLAVPRINRIISASYTLKKIRVALQTYPKGIRR
ncbi:WcbI family polysaccharide biosynthesis putative acetyltransferase [Acidiphilium acidophilum]|uniref:WcbI family polysaccharide biosynthesis putative acetyltransferase n=1 Tax=Acidiphilium acidophilum TaxID=76588 RepID=A0AAW9DPA4_ACIAO|nr:WcbI family polysaccharide biosynthesis putative acetyltransferase [Acidiphilium acidophilum]MDX5929877.1 WcbI family polysaccharide biosynthesis putative acetyltransferase [Acidiphilium acidophilum]